MINIIIKNLIRVFGISAVNTSIVSCLKTLARETEDEGHKHNSSYNSSLYSEYVVRAGLYDDLADAYVSLASKCIKDKGV